MHDNTATRENADHDDESDRAGRATDQWNAQARGETHTERLDRNWNSLLQELRVVQTGVQLLTGFLLTLPFQPRFEQLPTIVKVVYLLTVASAIGATILLVAPVSNHRILFRRRKLELLVATANKLAIAGLILLGISLTGVVIVVFDVVTNLTLALVSGGLTASAFVLVWVVFPERHTRPSPTD